MRVIAVATGCAGFAWLLTTASTAKAVERGAEDRTTSHSVAIAVGSPVAAAFRCSGVLISANVVLTARHCVATVATTAQPCDAELGDVDEADVRALWVNVSTWTDAGSSWKNVEAAVVPNTRRLCGDDVALLTLAAPVPESEAVPARPVLDEAAFVEAIAGRTIGLSAFGDTGTGAPDAGIRRSRFDLPVGCVPGRSGFSCGAELSALNARSEFTTSTASHVACRGDSGGAALASSDHGLVLGVLSRSGTASGFGGSADGGNDCAFGIFERTDVWAWRIAKTVLDASSPRAPAPSWATALFPTSPRAGEYCAGEGACGDLARCVSLDRGRSLVCAEKCASDASCHAGQRCEQGVCVVSPPSPANDGARPGGCAAHGVSPSSAHRTWTASIMFALLALVSASRRTPSKRHS